MNTIIAKPHFKNLDDNSWFTLLKEKVNSAVRLHDRSVKQKMHIKALLLFCAYLFSYLMLVLYSSTVTAMIGSYILLGICLIFFFLNTAHDIAHNSFFKKAKWNEEALVLIDLLGDSSMIWKRRHVHYHHIYSNVQDWDMDIRQSPLVRIMPFAKFRWYHRFQHLYMPVFYLLYTLHVSWYRDFYDVYSEEGLLKKSGLRNKLNVPRFYLFKFFNLLHLLFIPIIFIPLPWYLVLAGFLIMHMTGSVIAAVALVSAHAGEDAVFVKAENNETIPHSWAIHQLITTTDFAIKSNWVTALFGGFNHHVAHHLFPSVSHGHYPLITKLIREFDKEYKLDYKHISIGKALLTHFHLLRNNSKPVNIFEE